MSHRPHHSTTDSPALILNNSLNVHGVIWLIIRSEFYESQLLPYENMKGLDMSTETITIPPEKYPKGIANGMDMEDIRKFAEARICRREDLKEVRNTIFFNAIIDRSLYKITCTFECEYGLRCSRPHFYAV